MWLGTAALHIAFASVVSRKEFCRATERAYNNLMIYSLLWLNRYSSCFKFAQPRAQTTAVET